MTMFRPSPVLSVQYDRERAAHSARVRTSLYGKRRRISARIASASAPGASFTRM